MRASLSAYEKQVVSISCLQSYKRVRRCAIAHFAIFDCFRVAEVLLFDLFQGKRFLEHDL